MAVNTSSSNDFLLHLRMDCLFSRPNSLFFTIYYITYIFFLLPLCILVLYLGLQRWCQQRSTSAAAAVISHSDSFTYHMVSLELICILACALSCCGIYGDNVNIFQVGYFFWTIPWHGETLFHTLTCVERYLAVLHPVIYLSLRRERGIRIRNICIGCVWLLCFGATSLLMLFDILVFLEFCLMTFSLIVISFCSLSVLRVLIRPGPGDQGGDRNRVDQSKRRAFYTIVAILGVMLWRCFANLVLCLLGVLSQRRECVLIKTEVWVNVPSSLVLPVLFLHRAGKLACCKNTK